MPFFKSPLRSTRSVCPTCLKALPAKLMQRPASDGREETLICRTCPEHGLFEEVVWRGAPAFSAWTRPQKPNSTPLRQTQTHSGCPHDCGLCPEHAQKSCAVLYELTDACNLVCPVCFAASGQGCRPGDSRSLEEHRTAIRWISEQAGQAILQLSGGEPTLYPDLVPLVREANRLFPAVQLNTNGLVLAERPELALELAEAGLDWVFLQFDGTDDAVFTALRGKALLDTKLRAIENCRKAGLAVVLVPTVAAGVNEHELGNLVRFGIAHAPTVRGIHLQPMTRSGRNVFANSADRSRHTLTLPEILCLLEEQTNGLVKAEHASPPGCEHERCSFHCRYTLQADGSLTPSAVRCCCSGDKAEYMQGKPDTAPVAPVETSNEGADRAIASVIRNWQKAPTGNSTPKDAFEAFISRKRASAFSVTCMAFQDAWNLDLERLQGCCIHCYAPPAPGAGPEGRLIPFCAYNLTSTEGKALYRS